MARVGQKLKVTSAFIVAVALVLSLWLVMATPVLALPEITLSPASGAVGTRVTVTGTDFESFRGTDVSIFFDNVEIAASPLTVPDSGTFTTDFIVPDDAEPGTVYVKVTTVIGGEVRKSFTIEEAEIELDIDRGVVGTTVTVTGRGFFAGGAIDLYYNQDGTKLSLASEVVSDSGEFSYTFTVPDSSAGEHKITGEDELDNSAEAVFRVIPSLAVSPSGGAIGDRLVVKGSGFGSRLDVTVYFNEVMVAEDINNKYGSFEVSLTVPAVVSGRYQIAAEDEDGNRGEGQFTVASVASLSQSSGAVGTALTVTGVGFKANVIVAISYGDEEVATAATDGNGAFSVNFTVPPSPGGPHKVTITDGTNTAAPIFTMETEAPPAPSLLSPEDETKALATTEFDWEDVEDASGVTYTLEVATKESFTDSSIVLEKLGLTGSEYAVGEEEALEPSSQEAPHYWRVKAVDGAANESEWSAVSSFYVGSSFTLSETAKRVLIGLGIAGAGVFGFWLGRRTAYVRRES